MNRQILHEIFFIIILAFIFVLIRLPGAHLPLHQDEYKWPIIVNPSFQTSEGIPHPPLGEIIYRTAGYVVGFNVNFRFVPLFFGTLNLLLLYYLMHFLFGRREAIIASLIWIFGYFSVLASLMVDTDGEIMPFFFLLALIGYYKLLKKEDNNKYWWGALFIAACTLGFLVKISFALAVGAIIADFLWSKKNDITRQDILRYIVRLLIIVFGLGVVLLVSQKVFPFFHLGQSIVYWKHFATTSHNWFQTAIQCAKVIFYLSPALILIPLITPKEIWSKARVFIFFLIFAFIFYIILFDFSIGALDRYLELLILPLSVISALVISSLLPEQDGQNKKFIFFGILIGLFLVCIQFIPHYVPPLHPKSEWISRALSLKWNFLYPFSGGSGPLGFYVSFLFMALSWVISFTMLFLALLKPQYKKAVLILLVCIGITYNGVFIEEYLFGYVNGHAPKLLLEAVEFIKNDPDIKMVTVYNDNGGKEIQDIDKYRKRLYVDPMFDPKEKLITLNIYKEHYFVLDIPRINPSSIYQKYFNACKTVYIKTDKKISATIYDCRGIPDVKAD